MKKNLPLGENMIGILGYLFIMATSHAQIKISNDNIDELIERNSEIESVKKRLESSEALLGSLKRSFLPQVSLKYGQERFSTGPYKNLNQSFGGIEAELNIFNSGRDQIEDRIRVNDTELAQIDVKIFRFQLISELKKTLSHHAFLRELNQIIESALDLNERNLRSAEKRINAGLASSTDLLDFKQQKLQLIQEKSSLEFEEDLTERLIKTLIGQNVHEEIVVEFQNSHPDHSDESHLNFEGKSLLVRKEEVQRENFDLMLEKKKKWWLPRLDAYGYAQRFTQKEREYNPSYERNDFTVGFKFTIPLFDGGEGLRDVRSIRAIVESKNFEVFQQERQSQRQTVDALKKLELAHEMIHNSEESVKIMNEYRQGIFTEYSKGVKNSPDVLQASQRWVEAKIKNAEVKRNYQIAKVEAEFLSQMLTSRN
jgi:outer membrane protein TolC